MNLLRGVRRGRRAAGSSVATAALVTIGACSPSVVLVDLAPVTPTPTGVHHIGQFVWADLVTDDMEAAKRFYGGLFGWQFEDAPGDPVLYSVIHHLGVPIGGIAPIDDADVNVASARWLSLMSVEDVDEAVDRVLRAGGHLDREPWDNPTRGRLAVVTDPQGATVAFVRSRGGDPPNLEASDLVSGRWMWIELWARDVTAAITLYQSVAGYGVEGTDVFASPEYRVLTRDGRPRAGVNQIPWPEVQPNWLPYIKVDDPAAVARRARELGGSVLIPPLQEVRNGSAALLLDPTGAAFGIQRWPVDGGTPGGTR
ncbi:MAG: VOC family protein [Gemmatimonadetes bacterium]|nr:VOC family protein [Gemmatimonadota bacterium]